MKPSQPGPIKYFQLANGEIMAYPLHLYYHNQMMSATYSNMGQTQTAQYGNNDNDDEDGKKVGFFQHGSFDSLSDSQTLRTNGLLLSLLNLRFKTKTMMMKMTTMILMLRKMLIR